MNISNMDSGQDSGLYRRSPKGHIVVGPSKPTTIRIASHVVGIVIGILLAVGATEATSAEALQSPPVQQSAQKQVQQEAVRSAETPIAPIGLLSPTIAISSTANVSSPVTAPVQLLPTPTPVESTDVSNPVDISGPALAQSPVDSPEPVTSPAENPEASAPQSTTSSAAEVASDVDVVELADDEPLQGTMVANRTNYEARFFLEGRVYQVGPFNSANLNIARSSSVMNLYTCDASTPESQEGCFWDPYVVQSDGFYEIVDESAVVGLPELMLQNVNGPPANQVWIHNRTGVTETIVFRDVLYDVAPGAVQEFQVDIGAPVIVYARSCAQLEGDEVCEWAPESLDPGSYFGLVEVSTPGGVPGSSIVTLDFRPVVGSGGDVAHGSPEMTCVLAVPALNIRSGPGLQYQILGKVRSTETGPGSVVVTGRSADDMWYTVAGDNGTTGWVTSNPDFVTCDGTRNDLPIAEFNGEELEPFTEPEPQVATQSPEGPVEPVASQAEDAAGEPAVAEEPVAVEEEGPALEPGQSLLVINNGFHAPIRFTIDQQYRPNDGPSEYDLEPSASAQIITYPGKITFSVSTPWRGLSGNGDIEMVDQESTSLWLRFQPDPDGSDNWDLAWD